MDKILTGSREFFAPSGEEWPRDEDHIVFQPQDEPFRHLKEQRGDLFSYKQGLSKQQYFEWHQPRREPNEVRNKWALNFAPLITKAFLDHLRIDIFGADRDAVYKIMRRAFMTEYRFPQGPTYKKHLYRLYIYKAFIDNGRLELTDDQLQTAYALYRQRYGERERAAIRALYDFFQVPPGDAELGMGQVFPSMASEPRVQRAQAQPAAVPPRPQPPPPRPPRPPPPPPRQPRR